MTVQCLNINILLHSSSCLWIVIARMRKGKYKHFTFPSDSLRASCYYNSIRLLLYGNEKFVSSCLPVERCRKTIHPISSLCGRHTRVCACAWKREKEREREATRILRVPWPMLRLDNRSGGEVTRPRRGRRYRRESARSAPRNQLERSLKLQVINDASKPVTNPHGSSRQRDTLIISPPSWIIGRIDEASNYQSPC